MPGNPELSGGQALRAMLHEQGYLVVELSHERIVALLTDYAADCSARTQNLLRVSVQLGVHRELKRAGPDIPFTVMKRCAHKLIDEGGLQQAAVDEVLDAWLTAFRFSAAKSEEPTTAPTPTITHAQPAQSHWLRDLIGVGIFAAVYLWVRMTFDP